MYETQNLTALAVVLAAAVGCGFLMSRIRMTAAAGFILVGVALGPSGLGLIHASASIETLAELGVLMLLFIIGMEMRLKAFLTTLPLSLWVTTSSCLIVPVCAVLFTYLVHGELLGGVVIGFILSISSTAVAMKMIEDAQEKDTPAGRVALAILVAQDLAVAPLLLITDTLDAPLSARSIAGAGTKILLALLLLSLFIALLNKVKSFRFPASEYLLKNFDVGTLAVLGLCFASAALSGLMGLSPPLGAFLGGLAIGHSTLRRAALVMAQPIQSILLFAFFLSVGLLIDLDYLVLHIWIIAVALVVVILGKTLLNFLLLVIAGEPFETAIVTSLFLSPIGEFSFVIAGAGLSVGALSIAGHKLAIAVIAMSLLVSPIFFLFARYAHGVATRQLISYVTPADQKAVPTRPGPGE